MRTKLNKKGFTLIELLAVIIVLGLVATVTVSTVYTCPSGYTKNGSACYKTETISANKSTSYTDWVYSYQKTSSTPLTDKTTEKYVVAGVKVNSSCKSPCTNMYTYTYDVYTRSPKTTYTCPSGYTKNGTTCSKTVVISGNKSYTCPSGYTKNGTTCSKSVKTTKAATVSYSCPSGYSKMGDACVKRGSTTKAATVSYSCPSGYSQSGSTCYMSNSIAATPRISSYCSESGYGLIDEYTCVKTSQNADIIEATVNTTYSCPNNTYTLSGKNCYKTKTNSETKPATENKTYSCPEGYKQNNNMCEKTVTKYKRVEIYKDVTYYRSRVREYIAGSIDYKWSRSQNDISLIKKGYVLTGKSRVVE